MYTILTLILIENKTYQFSVCFLILLLLEVLSLFLFLEEEILVPLLQ